jgi:hypothetical protein
MKAGSFRIDDYLEKLHESNDGGLPSGQENGLIIPEENQKSFSWLKREYDKSKVEVKVEMKLTGAKFEPGYDLQTDLKSVKDFKPGMYGNVKTSDTPGSKKEVKDIEKPGDDKKVKGEKDAESRKVEKPKVDKKIKAEIKTAEDTSEKSEDRKKDDKS